MFKPQEQAILYSCWRGEIPFDSRVEEAVKPYLIYYANSNVKRLNGIKTAFEDLYNVGLTAIWKHLQTYKLICSECGKRFDTIKQFSRHSKKHRKAISPLMTLPEYLKFNVMSDFNRIMVAERAKKRMPKSLIIRIDHIHNDNDSHEGSTFEIEDKKNKDVSNVEFKDLIEVVLKDFDEIEREIIFRMLKDNSFAEIIERLKQRKIKPKICLNYSLVKKTLKKLRLKLNKIEKAA